MTSPADRQKRSIDTIRTLCIDAVQQANSGHPGTPMAMAPVAYTLWQDFLRYDPADPAWPNRDRFVLSAGHASTLLYSLLHLAGVKAVGARGEALDHPAVPLEELKRFRQLDSLCPGHPEHGLTSGVEATTGPLGQGFANSVGMAIAGAWLAARYDRPGFTLFDHRVYALGGDGCMMEGITAEAASLAGHLRLANLCWIYDSNRITIEGSTDLAFSEDVAARFAAYGWDVLRVADANDLDAVAGAFAAAGRASERPTLIVVQSHIGYGAPGKQDTAAAHGEPLGPDVVKATKRAYGWPEEAQFLVPDGVREDFQQGIGTRGRRLREAWDARFAAYRVQHPDLAAELDLVRQGDLPAGWDADLPVFPADPKGMAGREASGRVLNAIAQRVPWLVGGAADLAPSTKTHLTFAGAGDLGAADRGGRNLHFGIREHAMAGVVNGLALSHLRAYGSTFLVFSDYCRPSLRLAALMELPVVHVFTHDSIGVGEDGPTHQPVEHAASLRAIPGLLTIRPADANEVTEAWRVVMPLRHEPAAILLSRQALPTFDRARCAPAAGLARGAYVLRDAPGGAPQVLLLATGSEVALCLQAQETLAQEGVRARVVSLPCWELFERQDAAYRESVLPAAVTARVAVEAGSPLGWERYAGPRGRILAMRTFGASAPLKALQERFGFTAAHVAAAAREALGQA
jgi:transketolase